MGGYTLSEFRTLVRTQLDADTDDLSDTLVDVWVREGWRFCVNRKRRWPFYASTWDFTSEPGWNTYPLANFGSEIDTPLEIEGVLNSRGEPLRWVGPEQAGERYGSDTGTPVSWTETQNNIRLFPVPKTAESFTLVGYRKPVDWVAAGPTAMSDLPADFDDVILNWSVGRAFQRQEDGDLGVMHLDQADVLLRALERRWTKHAVSAPLILNDGVRERRSQVVNWNV